MAPSCRLLMDESKLKKWVVSLMQDLMFLTPGCRKKSMN